LTTVLKLSQINTAHNSSHFTFKIRFNIIIPPTGRPSKRLFPWDLTIALYAKFHLPHAYYVTYPRHSYYYYYYCSYCHHHHHHYCCWWRVNKRIIANFTLHRCKLQCQWTGTRALSFHLEIWPLIYERYPTV